MKLPFVTSVPGCPSAVEDLEHQAKRVLLETIASRRRTVGLPEDVETPVGSLFFLETPTRALIDAFTYSDPYRVNGMWEKVDVH